MFEGYSRNKYTSTGVIQWMLNNAFPSMIWHLYDFYFQPAGAYFGAKKGCEPLHPQFSYNDASVWLVNSLYDAEGETNVTAQVYDVMGNLLLPPMSVLLPMVPADSALHVFDLPLNGSMALPMTYFLRLSLPDRGVINDYWLSSRPDILDWDNSTFYTTFCSQYADFTSLQHLPSVGINTEVLSQSDTHSTIAMTNLGAAVSLLTQARLIVPSPDGQSVVDIAPILWSDNFVTLLPYERRVITATYGKLARGVTPRLWVYNYNGVVAH